MGAFLLILIGALNWGLIGVTSLTGTRLDLVEFLFMNLFDLQNVAYLVYIAIGISAIIVAYMRCICDNKKTDERGA